MLKIGQKAPEFSLPNQDDIVISLKDFKGQKLLIWFFPKASTSGCTKEGIGFNELIKNFNKQNISILGLVKIQLKLKKTFAQKMNLNLIFYQIRN